MKIKNESILIKVGNKEYNFTNLILNTYLKRMISSIREDDKRPPNIQRCFLGFNKFDFDENSILNGYKFNTSTFITDIKIEESNKSIVENMQFTFIEDLSAYYGRMITNIGFSDQQGNFYACVDVSNAGIYIQKDEEITIYRKDILSTEADIKYITQSNKLRSPLHLISHKNDIILENGTTEYPKISNVIYAKLQTYGFGYSKFEMLNSFDIKTATFQDTSLTIDIINNLYEGLYPRDDLYPSDELFPQPANYNYITFKFIIYQEAYKVVDGHNVYTSLDTGQYYLVSMPLKHGQFQYKLKYEK